jgi:hypothetical protein
MRARSGQRLRIVVAVWLAVAGCSHADDRPRLPEVASETPDDLAKWCRNNGASCASVAQRLKRLVGGEHSDTWFWSEATFVRAGQPSELPPDVIRFARAVAWERSVSERLDHVDVWNRELADYDKKDPAWRVSEEGQNFFADRTLRRALAVDEAGREFRRRLGELADRLEPVGAQGPNNRVE